MNPLTAKLDNAINPIVVKELRQAVNGRFVSALLMLFLLVSVIVMIFAVANMSSDFSTNVGQEVMLVLNAVLLFTCIIVLPLFTAVRMAGERADTEVDLMYITTLPPRAIIWGKLVASMVIAVLVYSACMPFMTLSYLLRGIDLPTIFLVLGAGFAVVVLATMLGIFTACVSTGRGFRVLLGLALLAALGTGYGMTMGMSGSVVMLGLAGLFQDDEAWVAALVMLLGLVTGVWLLYTFAVALITSPSANRVRPVRLTMTAAWAINTLAAWAAAIVLDEKTIVIIWAILSVMFFGIGMLIAIGEREQWGRRVTDTIPRHPLARAVAFVTYSGNAGGLIWAWGMIVIVGLLMVGGAALCDAWFATSFADDFNPAARRGPEALQLVLGTALYIYAYAMTALLLRKAVFRHVVPPAHTWSLALVLGAVGCTLPLLIMIFVSGGDWYQDEEIWLIANPAALYEGDRSLRRDALIFTCVWSVIVTAIGFPALIGQWRNFRPTPANETSDG